MSDAQQSVVRLSDGDIQFWIEDDSSLHLKCVTKFGDPVELNAEEVRELCRELQNLAERID